MAVTVCVMKRYSHIMNRIYLFNIQKNAMAISPLVTMFAKLFVERSCKEVKEIL